MKHSMTSKDLYENDRRNINGQHPAKYALYFIFWLLLFLTFIGVAS